jgi:DNA repair protein RecO (recombination protein O)
MLGSRMPTITENAVCIRHWDFSETSQTVSLFTREHGIIRGLAKGAKREKGDFSGGIDVLTRGQIVAIIKPGRDLATLTQWTLLEVFRAVRNNLEANRAGLYMAELVHQMVREADPHPLLFDSICENLVAMEQPARIGWSLLRFQWAVLKESGYEPETRKDAATGKAFDDSAATTLAFSPRAGGVVADTGQSDRWRVRSETVALLRALAAGAADPPTDIDRAAVIGRANRLLASYIREILGSEPPAMRWAFPVR